MKLKSGRFCPGCKGNNIMPHNFGYDLNPDIFKCKDCSYEGIFPTAKIERVNKIQNNIKKINKRRK